MRYIMKSLTSGDRAVADSDYTQATRFYMDGSAAFLLAAADSAFWAGRKGHALDILQVASLLVEDSELRREIFQRKSDWVK